MAKVMYDGYDPGLVTQGKTPYSGPSPMIWSRCPTLEMIQDPGVGFRFFDDFLVPTDATGAGAGNWRLTGINEVAGTDFVSLASLEGGVVRLQTHGADNDATYAVAGNNVGGWILTPASGAKANKWWFEARVKLGSISVAQGLFLGLIGQGEIGTDLLTTDTMAMKVAAVDAIGLNLVTADGVTNPAAVNSCVKLAGSAVANVKAGITTLTAGTWVKLGMVYSPGEDTITYYVNGVAQPDQAKSSTTGFPVSKYMIPVLALKSGDAGPSSSTLDVDWVCFAALRS